MSQSVVQLQLTEMQFWLDKVEGWGPADIADVHKDTCFYLSSLSDFLRRLLQHITSVASTTETMKNTPSLGQIVGRLCWNPVVTANDETRALIIQCLWALYTEHPGNTLERKANQWVQRVLCQLATEDDTNSSRLLLKGLGLSPTQYHQEFLKKVVKQLQENSGKTCNLLGDVNRSCSCDRTVAISEACIPLITCAEVAPLIGAVLQRPLTCTRSTITDSFLGAVNSAYSSGRLALEDHAVVVLWYHSLPSLEEAVLNLLESTVLANAKISPQKLQQQITQSLLPKACAQYCSMFLVVNDIFRSILKKREDLPCVRTLIQTFMSCFYKELTLLHPQTRLPLKAFFPLSPQSLLPPLLTPATEVPGEARRRHLYWLSGSLRRLTEEEEEAGGTGRIFEAWFLVVQCSHWVQAALQLLLSTQPIDVDPLLWLLTFYHHPTNRGHCRDVQLVHFKEAWDHLHHLFFTVPALAHPLLPVERLHSLLVLISPCTQRPSAAPLLIVDLVVNCAVFSQQSLSVSTEIVRTVVARSGLVGEAMHVLDSLEHQLKAASCQSNDDSRVVVRIKELHNTLQDVPSGIRPSH
ncbi:Fanconi anemia group C protein [Entelurus aequoreus]|uniref:Fanconi anemia group C protein n=1 Tax=Entelurus aequoreus TaxID=161455 RepID=UPI002B1DC40E|nr:Fanconi anemia group C protein [Entelurus aequoreus]XP_061881721.1 Fanconi anemia group C protein [Entelurus aequoreus]XP_061881722.1 Fanconi anemia group C protein [Entelurus aequoreus]